MKKNKIIAFVLMMVLFAGCENQPAMLVGGMFKSMFNVSDWFSSADKEYEELKNSKRYQEDVLAYCRDKSNDKYTSIQQIKDSLCKCMPWGSCDKGSCSCDVLCPTDFKIFNRTAAVTDQNVLENSMAFTNGSQKFYDSIQGYQGFCWGHASLTSKFNRLAVFDASKEIPYKGDVNQVDRIRYFESLIDQVSNNEPVDIPGFKNLNDFSKHPEIQPLLMKKVGSLWSKHASSFQGTKSVFDNSGLNKSESDKLISDIETRLANNQQPSLLFNQASQFGSAHVVLVQKIYTDPSDSQKYICIRDNNFSPVNHTDCGNRIKVKSDGSLSACRYGYDIATRSSKYICESEIGNASVVHNENRDSVDQVKNLHKKCAADKDCPSKVN